MAFYSVHDSHNYLCYYVTRYLIFRNIIWILHWSIGLSIIYYDVNKFSSYKYLKLSHHKHGTETFIKKNAFLIKSFFLSKNFKIYFWLCCVFIVLASLFFAAIRLWILHINLAGVWLETGILMLLLVSPEDSMSFFLFGCAKPFFFLLHVGFL